MPAIVLATINAKYIHASFGLRNLRANLAEMRDDSQILEFGPQGRASDVVATILDLSPTIVGFGVYIWNAQASLQAVQVLKRVAPQVKIVLGGPEVSYETQAQEITRWADYVITGEGEETFKQLCRGILAGKPSLTKVHAGQAPELETFALPYDEYTDVDLAQRVVYVEASRGCPFRCEFCLSSLDKSVRAVPLQPFLAALDKLLQRGLRRFKFVDRTFNLKVETSRAILEFFLERYVDGLFLHFEMIPDRLPTELRATIERFPAGSLQFEVGVQSFNEAVNDRISRRQNIDRLSENFAYLREQTGVHVHADLIIGLPGESLESFGAGLDRLYALGPQEIQLGILKRLRGAPIARHEEEWQLVFDPQAPYEVLSTRDVPFAKMQAAKRLALLWDRVVNQGNFNQSTRHLLFAGASPFARIGALTEHIYQREGRVHGLALEVLARHLDEFLVQCLGIAADDVRRGINGDLERAGHRPLATQRPPAALAALAALSPHGPPPRQRRHLRAAQVD